MRVSKKASVHRSDDVVQLRATVDALTARIEQLEGGSAPNGHESGGAPQSRRDLLKLAGAAAAGAAGSIVLGSIPAAAANGDPITLGTSTGNDAGSTTDIYPTGGTAPSPLFQATGQGASSNVHFSTGTFPVQSLWSNAFNSGSGGCVLSY